MRGNAVGSVTVPELTKAEVLNVSEGPAGRFNIYVRCPHCLGLHTHREQASDLAELQRTARLYQPAPCSIAERLIMGIPGEPDRSVYVLNGLSDLDEHDLRVNVSRYDPHSTGLSGEYSQTQRMTKALELIRSAPGLTGFSIEQSSLTPLTMLVRDGGRSQMLILAWVPTSDELTEVPSADHSIEIVLQRHEMIKGRYRYNTREDVMTMEDPGRLLRGVYDWLCATAPRAAT